MTRVSVTDARLTARLYQETRERILEVGDRDSTTRR